MGLAQLKYLVRQNWRIYGRIKGSFGKNQRFTFPRIYGILPVVFFLGYVAYRLEGLVSFWLIFGMALLFLELGKVVNKCSFDPIHFFYFNGQFSCKFRYLIVMELFGIKLLVLLLFGAVALSGPSTLTALSILVFLYCFLVTFFVFMSVVGNRMKTVSVVYLWLLIMGFSFLFGFSGLSSANDRRIFEMHLPFQQWVNSHYATILLFLVPVLIGLYYTFGYFTKQVYEQNPFINPASFPYKMI